MAIIKCKMCGGDIELSADKTFGTCEYCGSVMTLPKIEDDQRAAAFNRGNHFRRVGEFDKALAVYERIVAEDNTDAEAHWCCALCRFGIEYVEDPTTYEWLPTCHRASFDSILEDVDYLAALEYSDGITRRQYQKDGAKIAEVQRAVLATSQKEEPFDVFICYKESDEDGNRTVDSTLAQDIYYQLTDKGYRVFFSRITLEDKVGAEYEPYIFAALNSAKVMVAVGTKPEYFNAVWVKNEWSRFLALMRKDRSKLLLPCYRDMDPYDLPEQLSVLQSYDMSKIGFIQDLIRGVSKVLDAEKEVPVAKETVIVQNEGGSNVEALLMRGQIALEDKDWSRADNFYEQVLNQDAKCAEAYLGKLLAREQCATLDYFVAKCSERPQTRTNTKSACEETTERINAAVEKYAVSGYCDQSNIRPLFHYDRTYQSEVDSLLDSSKRTNEFFKEDRLFSRAVRFANGDIANQLRSAQDSVMAALKDYIRQAEESDKQNKERIQAEYAQHIEKAEEQAAQMHAQAVADRDALYQSTCQQQEAAATEQDAEQAAATFSSDQLKDYQDSNERAEKCRELAKQIREKKEAELRAQQNAEERRKKAEAEERNRKLKKGGIALAVVAVLVAACYCVATMVVIPMSKYNNAEKMLENEDYQGALTAFQGLEDYKDSQDKADYAQKGVWYIEGKKHMDEEDYSGAITFFKKAESFKDAEKLLAEANATRYKQAKSLLEAGQYDEAYELLEALGKEEEANVSRYERAAAAEEAGEKQRAAGLYLAAFGYQDSAERARNLLIECNVTTVSAGTYNTVGLRAGGTVVALGSNGSKQCNVSKWKDIVAISAGYRHTVGLRLDRTVVAVGSNEYGQCNVSEWKDIVAVSTGYAHTVGLRSDGTVVAVGYNGDGRCDVSEWKDIVAVSAGSAYTVGLRSDGTVVAVGKNKYGQSDVDKWKDTVAVSAGGAHTVGLRADGTVVAVGYNGDGQCDVDKWKDIVAVSAGDYHTVGLRSDGTVVAVGKNEYGQSDVDKWKDIVAVSAGGSHTVGLRSDGSVVAVGYNGDGRCDVKKWKDIKVLGN